MTSATTDDRDPTTAYPPSAEFAAEANADAGFYQRAAADREAFWAEQAGRLHWHQPFTQVLDWTDAPVAKWFVGGKLNVAYNCVDRHVLDGHGDQIAIHWEGEPGDTRTLTYQQLLHEVSRAANTLTDLGLTPGDRVAIYMPMVPEAIIAMLACARLGLTHSVVFAGFSPTALRQRVDDAAARLIITTDGQWRRGTPAPLKAAVDEALGHDPTAVEHVLVVRRTGIEVPWTEGRDLWWHDTVTTASPHHEPQPFDAEHPLFILYTSGTTGKPKGILHTTGGYLTQTAYTHHTVFDHKPGQDIYWCTADIGWVTGHSYIVYGPLANRTTQIVYEGTPNSPTEHRHFEIIEQYGVTIYYTAPTLVRTFMKWGRQIPDAHDLSSLRLLGSVGEPINPEAWRWYREVIGANRTPIVDTWWQTETGAIMISPLPGVTAAKPGAAMTPLPGISARVVDEDGGELASDSTGLLVLDQPWPSMLRGIWGDPQRFRETYWQRFAEQGWYFAGDGAKLDTDGDLWILGRVDDVMNVSGHRISTAEVESALVAHHTVAEAAVVGATDPTTGQGIVAFVILTAEA
ncbi:acetate--CoA ligase, partial [Nocardia gamkensis]